MKLVAGRRPISATSFMINAAHRGRTAHIDRRSAGMKSARMSVTAVIGG
jgi:hypothetical protein